jgi:hypothetical protein
MIKSVATRADEVSGTRKAALRAGFAWCVGETPLRDQVVGVIEFGGDSQSSTECFDIGPED